MKDPNRPVSGVSHDDEIRITNDLTGNAGKDGYTVLARRPRVSHIYESIDPDKASEIENMERGIHLCTLNRRYR